MMEYLKWQIIIIIYLFTSVFIIFFEKYDYDVLENNSLQSFGKGRIGFLSDIILYNVVEVGENERYFYGKNIILSDEVNKEDYFIFDKKEKKSNLYFSKEELENVIENINLDDFYRLLCRTLEEKSSIINDSFFKKMIRLYDYLKYGV